MKETISLAAEFLHERDYCYNGCISLNESGTQQITSVTHEDALENPVLELSFLMLDETLFIGFIIPEESCLEERFNLSPKTATVSGDWVVNSAILEMSQAVLPQAYQTIYQQIMQLAEDGEHIEQTVYTGHGLGACVAAMAAVKSPPSALITFGMPLFCNGELENSIHETLDAKAERLDARNEEVMDAFYADEIDSDECYEKLTDPVDFTFANVLHYQDSKAQIPWVPSLYKEPGEVLLIKEDYVDADTTRLGRYLTRPLIGIKDMSARDYQMELFFNCL